MITDIKEIEKRIDRPAEAWKGNCYAIATACVEKGVVVGRPEYGIWQGEIAPGSFFAGHPLVRHGWVKLPGGQIFDPTRWVFEDAEPYVYVGPEDFYDMGAADLREKVLGYVSVDEAELMDFLDDPYAYEDDLKFLHQLANTPPKAHPFFMAEVYELIDKMGKGALIPIDYQEWAGI